MFWQKGHRIQDASADYWYVVHAARKSAEPVAVRTAGIVVSNSIRAAALPVSKLQKCRSAGRPAPRVDSSGLEMTMVEETIMEVVVVVVVEYPRSQAGGASPPSSQARLSAEMRRVRSCSTAAFT